MTRHILVPFFIPAVLCDVMKVVPSHYQGVFHLSSTNHKTFQNTATNRHVSSKRTFLIDIVSVNCCLGGLKSQSYVLVVPESLRGKKYNQLTSTYKNELQTSSSLLLRQPRGFSSQSSIPFGLGVQFRNSSPILNLHYITGCGQPSGPNVSSFPLTLSFSPSCSSSVPSSWHETPHPVSGTPSRAALLL